MSRGACARYLNGSPNDALYEDLADTGVRAELALGNCGPQTAGFFHLHRDHVDWVFVDNPVFHRPGALKARCCQAAAVIAWYLRCCSDVSFYSLPAPMSSLLHSSCGLQAANRKNGVPPHALAGCPCDQQTALPVSLVSPLTRFRSMPQATRMATSTECLATISSATRCSAWLPARRRCSCR